MYDQRTLEWMDLINSLYDKNIEEWREIPGFPGNEASTHGRLRTYWYRVRNKKGRGFHRELWDTPRPIPWSPKGDGYWHVNIYCDVDKKRYTRQVQVLIAHTFLPIPDDWDEVDYTVDHIRSGNEAKKDNSVWNLQWLSRPDNIKKAYREGVCNDRIARQRKDVVVTDLWTDEILYFESITQAARELDLSHSSISHALRGDCTRVSHYTFDYADGEARLLYASEEYECYQRISRL